MAITTEQRAARRHGIFSSDVPRIMAGGGVSVALEKLGQQELVEEDPNTIALELAAGAKIEKFLLDAYEKQTGSLLMERSPDTGMHPEFQWLGSHPDAIRNPKRGVEGKTLGEYNRHLWGDGGDEVPDNVLWQCLTHCAVWGFESVDIPMCVLDANTLKYIVCERPPPIKIFNVPADADLIQRMITECAVVWECVKEGKLPPPVKPSDVRLIYRKDTGAVIEATDEVFAFYCSLTETRKQVSEHSALEEKWAFEIQKFMKDASELRYRGRTLVTWKCSSEGEKVDLKELADSYPSVREACLKTVPGSRRFLPKKLKGEIV
mgnify:CR=1 FL=1